jgi:hypothetical protein
MIEMNKQAIYVTTNAYDAVMLADGSWMHVDPQVMADFIAAQTNGDDFTNWSGDNRWDDFAETLEAAVDQGEMLAYYENGKLVVLDTKYFNERIEFNSDDDLGK